MKKTALVLSGGGSRGAYEIDVWKGLKKLRISIDMAAGTSVGAINGAMVAQKALKQAEHLWLQMETDMIFDIESSGIPSEDAVAYAREIVLHGGAGSTGLAKLLHQYINEDKIRRSSIEYGLVTVQFPSFEKHALYARDIPKGRLTDFIMASASCFPAVRKYDIDGEYFIDGGYRDNLPVSMALAAGADRIIAVDLEAVGTVDRESLNRASIECKEFHLIKSPLPLGNFLTFDRLNTARIMRLGYLDTLRHFGKYDGIRYTFKKGEFSSHQLLGADNAAYFLELDPGEVYTEKKLKAAASTRLKRITDTSRLSEAFSALKEVVSNADTYTGGARAETAGRSKAALKRVMDMARELVDDADLRMALVLSIADSLKEKGEDSAFLHPMIFKMLEQEIQAANFLIREKLI